MGTEDFEVGLGRRSANYAPLTPLAFLDWSAEVYPDQLAVVHGARRYTWSSTRERCRRLASALSARGIGRGDTVAVLLSNTPEMLEAHFGIPMTGAVLVPINIRLDAAGIAFILEHSEAKVLLVDRAFSRLAAAALAALARPPVVVDVDVDDPEYTGEYTSPGERIGTQDY